MPPASAPSSHASVPPPPMLLELLVQQNTIAPEKGSEFAETGLQGLELFAKHASNVWRNGDNGLQRLEGGPPRSLGF